MASKAARVGDVVIYTPGEDERTQDDCAAIVTRVHGPDLVNLRLVQDGEPTAIKAGVSLSELERVIGEGGEKEPFAEAVITMESDWRGSVSRGEGPRTWRSIGA